MSPTDPVVPLPLATPLKELAPSELLDAVVQTMPDGLFAVDEQARITCWNAVMEEITGYSADEVIGQHCSIMEGDACVLECSRGFPPCTLFSEGQVRSKRCRIVRRDGRQVEVVKNARLLRGPDGRLLGGIETVTDISQLVSLEEKVADLQCQVPHRSGFHGILGHAPSMQRLFDLLSMAARSSSSVLVTGDTGTGKELVAAAIHHASPRARGPLVRVSCAALSEGLLESELFGHVRGAFTGAVASRQGRFEAANGGTLVLDEIGDISLTVQTKLLRVLQEQQVERVGSNRSVDLDIRVVASTNRDLLALCDEGRFRRDLYYRLAVIPVHVPPLRERRGDIPLLVEHFIEHLNATQGRSVRGVAPAAMQRLVEADWPGNVRELEHAVEYAFVVSRGDRIEVEALPDTLRRPRTAAPTPPVPQARPAQPARRRSRRPDRDDILQALTEADGHREAAAARLGVTRMTLWKWMRDLDLAWP